MSTLKPPLARYVKPTLDDARMQRQFSAIRDQLAERSPGRRWWLASVALAAVVVAGLVFALRKPAALPTTEVAQITLSDGSRIEVDSKSTVRLVETGPKSVRLVLEAGKVECDVAHNPERSFIVDAEGYSVRVVGTRFSVGLSTDKISVNVERGRVSVEQDGAPARSLGAGETWSADLSRGSSSTTPATSASALATNPEPPASANVPPAPAGESAKQLFERAMRARAQGRLAEARQALQMLRTRYPDDSRAGLAAFELARLEQDAKKDPKKTAKLLSEAIDKAPAGSPLREDAEARRVEALDASGDRTQCQKARGDFLARYPKSVHKARVLKACSP